MKCMRFELNQTFPELKIKEDQYKGGAINITKKKKKRKNKAQYVPIIQ